MGTRCGVAIGVALLTASVAAQKAYAPPKTPWGDPDLRGTFTSDNFIGVPFERPTQYGDRPTLTDAEFDAREKANLEQIAKDNSERPETAFEQDEAANNAPRHWLERGTKLSHATSLVVDPPDGRLPALTPDGQRRQAQNRARFLRQDEAAEFHSYYDRCITRGVVSSILPAIYGNGTRILQGPGVRRHPERDDPRDAGHPDRPQDASAGKGHPSLHGRSARPLGRQHPRRRFDELHRPDRGRRRHGRELEPASRREVHAHRARTPFTTSSRSTTRRRTSATWTAALDLSAKPGYEIYEYACHEGNYGLRNMLSASRADDKGQK